MNNSQWKRLRWVILLSITGFGFNPLICTNGDVEDAQNLLQSSFDKEKAKIAEDLLAPVEVDASEVHLTRALAFYKQEKYDEAKTSLDQAYRLLSDASASGQPHLKQNILPVCAVLCNPEAAWCNAVMAFVPSEGIAITVFLFRFCHTSFSAHPVDGKEKSRRRFVDHNSAP